VKSVRQKIVLVLALLVGLYSIGQCSYELFSVMPSFRALQHENATTEAIQCKSLVQSEIDAIARTTTDWSAWDDTYNYVADRNEAYASSNLVSETLKSNKLNVLYIVDCNGAVVWGRTYDYSKEADIEIPEMSPESIRQMSALYKPAGVSSQLSGILRTSSGPLMLSSSPIITSNREGPVRGVVIMGRLLDEAHVAELSSAFKMDLHFRQLGQSEQMSASDEYQIEEHGLKNLRISTILPDVFGRPSVELSVDVPTPITAKGHTMALFASVSSGVAALVVLCLIYWLLRKLILIRLAEIHDCISEVSSTGDLSRRAAIGGCDELSRVGENLNRMFGRLGEMEKALALSEERFRAAFLSAPFPIMIHSSDGAIVQTNERWTQLTGYAGDDVRTIGDWLTKLCETEDCLCQGPGGSKGIKDGLCKVRTRNGHSLMWELTSAALGVDSEGRRLTLCIGVDVTQRELAQRQLTDSENRYRSLSESIPAVICTMKIDRSATVLYISPQVTTYFGYSSREFLRTPDVWKNIIYCDDYERVMNEFYTCCQQRKPFTCDYRALGRDGNIVWMHQEAVVVDTADGPVAQAVIFDVTHIRKLETQLRDAEVASKSAANN
jgi:PAS domain S-box-containing protein